MLVISINVHENVRFLFEQIENIYDFVKEKHVIVLNVDETMMHLLKSRKLPMNVVINPEIINKQRFHGSLFHGIYSNMLFALQKYSFDFFIILSSRTLFYNELTLQRLYLFQPTLTDLEKYLKDQRSQRENLDSKDSLTWYWSRFMKTKLAEMYLRRNQPLYATPHEGLVFHYEICLNMKSILENSPDIRDELFDFDDCIEEMALQTIACNEHNLPHGFYGFIYIGHGVRTHNTMPTNLKLHTYKVNKDDYMRLRTKHSFEYELYKRLINRR